MTLRVAAITAPGRFPTVVYDPGAWWSAVAAEHDASRLCVNSSWWRLICSPDIASLLPRRGIAGLLGRRGASEELDASGARASAALTELQDPRAFDSAERYVATVTPLAEHLELLNRAQSELRFSFDSGATVLGLDYDSSGALVRYARRQTLLADLIDASLEPSIAPDLALARAMSPRDLLTAMITVRLLRDRNPSLQSSLIDHGHQNFTLVPHLGRLRRAGTLDSVFDSIVELKDERDAIVPALVRAVAQGRAPLGFLRAGDVADIGPALVPEVPPPATPVFAPEPILWTRISMKRCYWNRCTFCVQNVKYASNRAPGVDDIDLAMDRIAAAVAAGYRIINFGDEALSPTLLERLGRRILERGIQLRWACMSKLERGHTPALFELMARSGCYEMFVGVESTSRRTLRLMDKDVEGLDAGRIRSTLKAASRAGIGLHVNLIAGFPGDTLDETRESVDTVVDALRDATNATWYVSPFMLLAGTRIADEPEAFGVKIVPNPGDMPWEYDYRLKGPMNDEALRIRDALPALNASMRTKLGWDRFGTGIGAQAAMELYFRSGHGAFFKVRSEHAFANPLHQTAEAA